MTHDFKKYPELTNRQMQLYYFESPHKQINEDFRATVVKVSDGDTIRVKCDFRDFNFPIRFIDVAAPEMDERGGEEARDWLASKILGEEVDIIINPKNRVGKWGRLLGQVFHRGMDLGEEEINKGLAVSWEDRILNTMPNFMAELEEHGNTKSIPKI